MKRSRSRASPPRFRSIFWRRKKGRREGVDVGGATESRVEWFHVFNVPSDAKHRVILQRGFVLLRVTIFTLERFHGIRGILQCRLQTGFIFSLSLCPSVRPSRLNKRQYTFRIVKSISKTDSRKPILNRNFWKKNSSMDEILEESWRIPV